jgi:exodeoxyribonuclease VII small subunit
MSSPETLNFTKAYTELEQIASRLKDDNLVDIDILINDVQKAAKMFKYCKERLENAEKQLSSIVEQTDLNKSPLPKKIGEDNLTSFDDDIPF